MQEVIPFIALMKEVYFIFDLHIPKLETFCEVFKDNQSCIDVADSKKFPQGKNISPLSIIIYKALYKRRLFRYAKLIQENKQ